MLSKFSVKKPYTIVVGIVLVLVLGVVSFTRMTTDLLPDISLPYAIVVTTYPGASPSEVEQAVSQPVEQAMATVSNIESVQSVSSENLSMVILEFSQTTNMDSVSLEMRESLDQISAYWDDSIGNPIIIKMNPDMLPVMIAAVEKEGLDSIGITKYVNDGLISDIESLEGVASVDTAGQVEQSVHVILRQDLIDAVNQKVKNAMEGQFADAESELVDAETELNDAKDELERGKEELESGREAAANQLSEAQSTINSQQSTMLSTEADLRDKLVGLDTQLTSLNAQREELVNQRAELQSTLDAYDTLPGQIAEMEDQLASLTEQKDALDAQLPQLEAVAGDTEALAQLVGLRDQIAVLEAKGDAITPEESMALETLRQTYAPSAELLASLGITEFADADSLTAQLAAKLEEAKAGSEQLGQGIAQLQEALPQLQGALEQIESALAAQGGDRQTLVDGIAQIDAGLAQMDDGIAQLTSAKTQLEAALEQISTGKVALSDALKELNRQQINAVIEMAGASAQLAAGEAQIDSGLTQLEQGKEQLEDQKEAALEGADMSSRITISTIEQILTAQNFTMPAGYVTEDGIQYLIRVGDRFADMEEMKDLVLFDLGIDGLDPIRLSDVAEVVQTDNSADVYARINGNDGILLTIQKQTGYSTGEVSDRINDFFADRMEEEEGLSFTALMDQGIYIDMVVNSVLENLGYGAVLAVLILFLFLRDVRPTAVVACSIPVSLLTAVVLMYFSGISLNVISLSGLALGVGMLVDNSIVVIENIYRLHGLGIPVRKAAVQGAKQMSGAILASTLTTVCVFLPIVFMEGITRQLFVDMGLTIAYSLLASLVIALTFVPMVASGLLKRPMKKREKKSLLERLLVFYDKAAWWALRHRALVLGAALLILLVSGAACVARGFSFMPEMESTQASVTVTMPEGSSVEETGAMTDEVIARISDLPDVEEVGAMIGGTSMGGISSGNAATNTSSVYLILSEHKELTGEELEQEVLKRTADLDCEVSVSASMMDLSALGGTGISIQIKGKEMDRLQTVAADVAEILEGVDGIAEVSDGMEETTDELRLVVNKAKASEHNLTVAQVFQQISAKLSDASSASTLVTESEDFPIEVEDGAQTAYTREDVKGFTITATGTDGTTEEIPVEELVEFVDTKGPDSIQRVDQSRYLTVSGTLASGENVTLVSDRVEDALASYEMPEGYSYEMTGEDATIRDAMDDMVLMLLLALIFMYLVMVAQFQSLLSPFIVMFTVPLAFTGGFLGILVSGMDVSIISMIGFVMLCGIIVNNGIVLVDYINQLRGAGMEKRQAIVLAGHTRMRPILMTALTTILGLATMAMGVGMSSEMTQAMAVVTIGGLAYGTLLTLLVVPCIYDLLNRREYVVIQDSELDAADEELDIMKETNLMLGRTDAEE